MQKHYTYARMKNVASPGRSLTTDQVPATNVATSNKCALRHGVLGRTFSRSVNPSESR
jgi:hypothetical protein